MIGYYYCSLDTFLNIFNANKIYLSDPLKMNDMLEIKWYLDRLKDDIDNSKKNKDRYFYSLFEMVERRSGIDFSCDDLVNCLNTKGQRSVYISCFSKEKDLLSQWREYADKGKGVAIGFDLERLAIANNFLVREVKYTDSVVYDDLESDVEMVADQISAVFQDEKINDKEMQIEVFLHELIPELIKYKNPAFEEEHEVRLIYCDDLKFEKIVNRHGAFNEKWEEVKLDHCFRTVGSNNITEYVELKFAPDAITDICIGPKCLLNKNDVLNISKTILDIQPNVMVSESSYR